MKYNLEKEGFKVDVATTGNEALAKMKSSNPDLILLDIMLPDIDGAETVIKIREFNSVQFMQPAYFRLPYDT